MLLAVGDQVWLAVIGLIGSMFASVMTIVLAVLQSRTNTNVTQLGAKVEEVHIATNSMKDELVKKTEQEALARGGVDERARADREKLLENEDTMAAVTSELAKLTTATDARVEGVSEQVEQVDDKVEQVRDVVVDKPKGTEKES